MQPKTEEFLYLLLWTAETLATPTFRNLSESYESWAYRKGLLRQAATLERRKFLERASLTPSERIYRLTTLGRLHALGGRDPEERWARTWDGQWRLILFDLPASEHAQREKLRRYLHEKCFGFLQYSVWITPDPLEEELQLLRGGAIDVESLLLLEARPCAGESDAEVVAGAWSFAQINRRYARHLKVLESRPTGVLGSDRSTAKSLLRWADLEKECWLDAVTHDPLLPSRLLPSDYWGQRAWRRRVEVLREAGRQINTFVAA